MECDVDGLLLRYVNDLEYKRNQYYWNYIICNEKSVKYFELLI